MCNIKVAARLRIQVALKEMEMNTFTHNEFFPESGKDEADKIIDLMIAGTVAAAAIPAAVNIPLFVMALQTGVAKIGSVYGYSLTSKESWKVVYRMFLYAGFTFLGIAVGGKLISAILSFTGLGHIAAVALDCAISGALAYAVGKSAKAYFEGEVSKEKLGKIFRDAFKEKKNDLDKGDE